MKNRQDAQRAVGRFSFGAAALALGLASLSTGCVQRTITDAIAHPTHNNYKVQTVSVYYWCLGNSVSNEVWTCHKDSGTFSCAEIDYETSKAGVERNESAAPEKEEAAPAEEEKEAAPAEAEAEEES